MSLCLCGYIINRKFSIFFVLLRITIRPFLVFICTFSRLTIHEGHEGRGAANRNRTVSFFAPKGLRIIAQGCGVSRYPGFAGRAEQP
ncbi:MAG: hypothetical protein BECKG1743D_GA0114223_105352 [Candidatus Kentron sp. G]|nr:MAG: hypothetical protein BECKG1743E_GA0114224_105222 [Candidatus Kentron sp. G]VFN03983.1 MAG: hypothetical protein BECKG1743D_GA0114223_105352 [Candidatus Kentron sp. G]VFN05050.1 MAG: hypothetical protein BECKG1743F_GA0114225_110191 [Candidatus Kentron sp. G]